MITKKELQKIDDDCTQRLIRGFRRGARPTRRPYELTGDFNRRLREYEYNKKLFEKHTRCFRDFVRTLKEEEHMPGQ